MPVPALESILLPDGRTLEQVKQHWEERQKQSEDAQRGYFDHWTHLYGKYRAYKEITDGYGRENDRDDRMAEARRVFGTPMALPYAFATVETILPRAVSNRPRMVILPDGDAAAKNVENMKRLIDRQQEQIAYELLLQETAKHGFIFGLGWQKDGWKKKTRDTFELQEATAGTGEWVKAPVTKTLFDDPFAANCWLFDMFWDPYAFDVPSCRYIIHRTWKDTRYVLDQLEQGKWSNPGGLLPEDVESLGPAGDHKWEENLQPLMDRSANTGWTVPRAGERGDMHEIWECHDCEGEIVTILDGQVPVHMRHQPYWHGEYPFGIYRPTTQAVPQIPGIGEVEPIEELIHEMDTLRANRRDNAALKLMQVFVVQGGFVDTDEWEFFPGALLEVPGDPREMAMQVNAGDIPNSGYQEELALKSDIEHATGLSEPVMGIGGQDQTATGVQLVQAAANIRIQLKSRRIEIELCAPTARKWVSMNQQMIVSERTLALPAEPTALEPARKWATIPLTPAELAGNFIVLPDGGSIAPENPAEKQMRAQQLMLLRGDPNIDQRQLYVEFLELNGIKNAVAWLTPSQHVPPILLDLLVEDFEIPQDVVMQALEMAFNYERAQLEGEHEPPAKPDPSANGDGPKRKVIERGDDGRVAAVREEQ